MSDQTAGGEGGQQDQDNSAGAGADNTLLGGGGEAEGGAGAGEGGSAASFLDSLPEDLKGNDTLGKYRDGGVEALARAHINLQAKFGVPAENILKMPSSPDDTTAMNEIFKRLGRPEQAGGYEIPQVAGIENTPEERLAEFKEVAHKAGLSAAQFKNIIEWSVDSENRMMEKSLASHRESQEKVKGDLKKELGDKFDPSMNLAQRAVHQLGGDDLKKLMDDSAIGDNALMIKAFIKVGEMMAEDTINFPDFSGGQFGSVTPEDARVQFNALIRDKDKQEILRNIKHPEYATVRAEYDRLSKIMSQQPRT